MQLQYEKIESELTELSDFLYAEDADITFAPLKEKLFNSFTIISCLMEQLKPSYNLKFSSVDKQKKQDDLLKEILVVCKECKVFQANQTIAEKLNNIEACLPGSNIPAKK